jgi:hypothetical protein
MRFHVVLAIGLVQQSSGGGGKLPGPENPHFMMVAATGCSGTSWLFGVIRDMVRILAAVGACKQTPFEK